jgi:hypothetical protein
VVVTDALLAAKVGRWKLWPTQFVAVPDPAVALSVYVFAAQLLIAPVVLGVPDLFPGVNDQAIDEVDWAVVTPAASRVCAYPSQSKAPDKGEIKDEALFKMLLNSAFKSDAVSTSPSDQDFTRDKAIA